MRQRTKINFEAYEKAPEVQALLQLALAEDLSERGDITSLALMPDAIAENVLTIREPGVVAGLALAAEVFRSVDSEVEIETLAEEGERVDVGRQILRVKGKAESLLSAERTALNFLQRLSGIATTTNRYTEEVAAWGTQILDTRKTTPGWRLLEKFAVYAGGGVNHRAGLYDQVLIKDNHLAHWTATTNRSIADAVEHSRDQYPDVLVEVEADTLGQVRELLGANPDWILLDNMSLGDMEAAVALCHGKIKTEASGGITFERLQEIARTGVDAISVGALTHSVRALDIGMDAG